MFLYGLLSSLTQLSVDFAQRIKTTTLCRKDEEKRKHYNSRDGKKVRIDSMVLLLNGREILDI